MKQIFLVIAIIVFCNTAFALELKKEIAKCTNVEGELARLNCYDKLADTVGVSKKKTTSQKTAGNWTLKIEKNPIDDTKTVIGVLEAKEGKSKWNQPITLILRCKSKSTNMYILWGSYLGDDDPELLIRVGDSDAVRERWNSSTDKTATFFSGDVIESIKHLEASKKFVAQVTPYMESPITAVFDLSGIEKVTKALREVCEWDKIEAAVKQQQLEQQLRQQQEEAKREEYGALIKKQQQQQQETGVTDYRAIITQQQQLQ